MLIFMSLLFVSLTACQSQKSPQEDVVVSKEGTKGLGEVGVSAVDFTLKDQYGRVHTLSKYRGKTVILIFWATWCPDCLEELADIEKLYKEYQKAKKEDVIILGVNTPNREPETDIDGITIFMEKNQYTFPTVMDRDGSIFEAYQILTYPTTYIIDPEGKIKDCIKAVMHYEEMKRIK